MKRLLRFGNLTLSLKTFKKFVKKRLKIRFDVLGRHYQVKRNSKNILYKYKKKQ